MEDSDVQKRIRDEARWCFIYEQEEKCRGASGRKLRQTCVWCPKYKGEDNNEKGN